MIRKDVWSVKVWDSAVEPAQHVHSRMFYAGHLAAKWSRENQEMVPNKIVHPSDWVVDAFVACGNSIEGVRVNG